MARRDARAESSFPSWREPRLMAGLRVSALIEISAFLAAALAIDHFLLDGDRLAGFTPHPFWIIVLLSAAQYGAKEGLTAALLASAALLVNNLPEQGFSEDLYAWLLRATREPLLWIFAAVIIGEIRDAQRRERDALREDLREAREHADGIGAAYEKLSRLKDHLEARVAGQVRTVHSIFTASRSIERQDTGQVLAGIQQLVPAVMNPRKFSLYLLNGRVLEAAMSEGWTDHDAFATEFDHSTALYQAVISHRRHLVATRPSHGLILGAEGLLAGPLTSSETGEVIGMLKIEEMDFLDLVPSNVQNFRILCEWIGSAYANAQHWEETQAARYFDPVRRLLPTALFEQACEHDLSMARRFGFGLSVLRIGFDAPEGAGPGLQPAAARAVSRAAEALLGPTERAFDWRRDGWDVALLLPGVADDAARDLSERLVAGVEEELALGGLKPNVRHRTEVLHRPQRAQTRAIP